MGRKAMDLIGMKFGRLTVIERVGTDKHKKILWLCKCECGNVKVVRGGDLKSGNTISCGCEHKERAREAMSKTMKKQWQNEDFRQAKIEKIKEQWQDEEFRQAKSDQMKRLNEEQWQDEEFRKMKSYQAKEQMKEQWQDEEMKWKMHYKGGITPIAQYLRSLEVVIKWRDNCQYEVNYTCELSLKYGGVNVHHLKAFSIIVKEAHDLHNIEIKPLVKDYTDEELKLLEEYVASWHKDNSNGIVLREDVHKLFHSLYGKGENTPEQFEEFRERYMAGEFKEILK